MRTLAKSRPLSPPVLHYATDRRCYYGAPCRDLAKEIDSQDKILKAIQQHFPKFRICYHPDEGKYNAHLCYDDVLDKMYEDRGQCLLAAWYKLLWNDK